MHKISLATLFSGIGTPEFAACEVFDEVETLFACEIDKFARKSYLANHEAPLAFYEDVCDLDAKAYAGQIDILIGGSPCQDFSIAGQRAGENGERGNLIWQFYRIVSEAHPKVFIYENVKGFLSINGGKSYQRFLDALRGLGYFCHAEILNTKDYGIPQNRERLYIVGFLDAQEYHTFCIAPKTGCKRLADFELCPTISSNSFEHNNLLKNERIRKLTPKECLRLQGFPESFKIVVSDTQTYKQAGNAMSVNIIKMIFKQIQKASIKQFKLVR